MVKLIYACGWWTMASSLLEESQFSMAFKCSAHLSKIFDRSVIYVDESEHRRGKMPEDVGP